MGEFALSPHDVYMHIGRADGPLLLDVCLCDDYDTFDRMLPAAGWRDPLDIAGWSTGLDAARPVVVSCVKGLKVSQAVAAELRERGFDAAILAGGREAWAQAGLPMIRKLHGIGTRAAAPSRWITRLRPKIDRIACPWLITRFIDADARFLFVEPAQVLEAARIFGAIPYDVEGCDITHRGEGCSFDALLDDFGLVDPALEALRPIVRGADTARPDLAPEAAGLLAVSLGISALSGADDAVALRRGFAIYDALYAWRRLAASETHNWPRPGR